MRAALASYIVSHQKNSKKKRKRRKRKGERVRRNDSSPACFLVACLAYCILLVSVLLPCSYACCLGMSSTNNPSCFCLVFCLVMLAGRLRMWAAIFVCAVLCLVCCTKELFSELFALRAELFRSRVITILVSSVLARPYWQLLTTFSVSMTYPYFW